MSSGYGLAVRWSLAGEHAGTEPELRAYVTSTSLARFTGMAGLRFKTWRMVEGEWFEGTYVFETAAARDEFAATFTATAATAPVSQIIGRGPEFISPFEVVAVAEGGSKFAPGAGPGAAR